MKELEIEALPRIGFSLGEAAASLGMSPRHLRSLWERGDLPAARTGRKLIFRPADLQEFLASRVTLRRRRRTSAEPTEERKTEEA